MRFLFVLGLLFTISCSKKDLECALHGDNAFGRVTYASEVPLDGRGHVRVEWSSNSFTSVDGGKNYDNNHALPTFSYSLCLDSNVTYAFRAFQDLNFNDQKDSGELSGNFPSTKTVPTSTSSQRGIVTDINITMDTP